MRTSQQRAEIDICDATRPGDPAYEVPEAESISLTTYH
jgi:hypothetical protein